MKRIFVFVLLSLAYLIFPEGGEEAFDNVNFILDIFVLFLGVFVFGKLATFVKLPKAIGYIIAGVVLSPNLFGSIPIPWLSPEGIFPHTGTSIPVKPEVFALSQIGVMLLLFRSGLETELSLLYRYIGKGVIVAVSEVLVSFFLGAWVTSLMMHLDLFALPCLFMGAVFTATSVGLTANILSEKRKMQSPEGVIIIASAVMDDILGIIVLAVILGISAAVTKGATLDVGSVGFIAFKAVGIWLVFTAAGIIFSRVFGKGLKKAFQDRTTIVLMSIGFAMLLGALFEKFGLSAVIGAYIIGLSLSNTDLAFLIQDKLKMPLEIFVPIFFVISGMYIDVFSILKPTVLIFALVYSLFGIISKVIGAGTPPLFLGFNFLGAMRIGFGMIPRAEVSIIIVSIGVSQNILTNEYMSAALTLVLMTSIITSILLNLVLSDKSGEKKSKDKGEEGEEIMHEVNLGSQEFATLIADNLTSELEKEDFIVSRIEDTYHIRKEDVFMSLTKEGGKLVFILEAKDMQIFNMAIKESFVEVLSLAESLQKEFSKKSDFSIKNSNHEDHGKSETVSALKLSKYVNPKLIKTSLVGNSKQEIITELVELMHSELLIKNKDNIIKDIMDREHDMSTGMTDNVAIPHAKTSECDEIHFAIGLKKEGIDWDSLDGEPSKIIFLIVSPKDKGSPYVLLLSSISTFLNNTKLREDLLKCSTAQEVYSLIESN